jgi:hypothetical protein
MSDQKITQLPEATMPLVGTEPVALVQGGETRRAPASAFRPDPVDLAQTDPAAPPAGTVRLFRREIAGRQMPAFIGPSGMNSALQPLLARNKVLRVNPTGNGTAILTDGATFQSTGTATTRTVATTNLFTRTRRIGYVSATAAGSTAGARHNLLQLTLGNGAGLGGFFAVIRFGFSAVVSDMRAFVGARNNAGAGGNVEPPTLTGSIGVGKGGADANLSIFYGGTAAQTPIPLGANFPANTENVDLYELALFAPPEVAETVHWQVTRLNTGHVASGTLTGGAAVLPAADVLLTPFNAIVSNNTTAAAVAIDFVSVYAETDY